MSLSDFIGYSKRLQKVRAELAEIVAELEPMRGLVSADDHTATSFQRLATATTRICNILIRVIDSLPT